MAWLSAARQSDTKVSPSWKPMDYRLCLPGSYDSRDKMRPRDPT